MASKHRISGIADAEVNSGRAPARAVRARRRPVSTSDIVELGWPVTYFDTIKVDFSVYQNTASHHVLVSEVQSLIDFALRTVMPEVWTAPATRARAPLYDAGYGSARPATVPSTRALRPRLVFLYSAFYHITCTFPQ
ncbi:hypothetical protein EVAR_47280_1 [Eumeta japonica]|uniref:Uncharacterized protein n=1 Tax=Eumeta variegata TaxID=151549 RepID=A0A4C1Z178_EUMVA|nr:hypothetical protein EVAR_47280_1 [Eumeta japonica]